MDKPSVTPSTFAAPAQPAGTYSISEAAELLGVDVKTIRNKIKALKFLTIASPVDRRVRLLTREQVHLLQRHLAQSRNNRTGITEMRADLAQRSPDYILAQALNIVQEQEERLAMREARLTEREQELDVSIGRFVAVFDKLAAAFDSRLQSALEVPAPPRTSTPRALPAPAAPDKFSTTSQTDQQSDAPSVA